MSQINKKRKRKFPHYAVEAARKLIAKAEICVDIAKKMLPGAPSKIIENQASSLMYLPIGEVLATDRRQRQLAIELRRKKRRKK